MEKHPAPIHERWEAHLVANEEDRVESSAALARVPQQFADDFDAALLDARSAATPLLHFAVIPGHDSSEDELRVIRAVIDHSIGERWHRVVGLLIRSEERSQSLVKSLFTLLCQVLDGRAPPDRFGKLERIPVAGVVWFGLDVGTTDPGIYALWLPVLGEVPEEYHSRCPTVDER